MKKLICIALLVLCSIPACFAQDKTSNRTVERNINWRTKVGYANLLVDVLKTADDLYSNYEQQVQDVWDNGTDTNLPEEAQLIQSQLSDLFTTVTETPVFTAGKDFQLSILNYINAMRVKIMALEKYGTIAADDTASDEQVNEAADGFDEASNAAAIKRNVVKNQYRSYARTFTNKDMLETKTDDMTLNVGDKIPDILGKDQDGKEVKASDYKGHKLVLYFYPKDNTPGCTAEACSLRDNFSDLRKSGYSILGVSVDDEKSHKKFIEKHELPFPLIADTNKELVTAFGVWGEKKMAGKTYMGTSRTTFLINEDGVIESIIGPKDIQTKDHAFQILNLKETI